MSLLFSRRTVLALAAGRWVLPSSGTPEVEHFAPVSLEERVEVRDCRLFPTSDVMRFIVELHNPSDTPVDTPAVGLVIPHRDSDTNFGWAEPIAGVLYPHSSACLFGVAPRAVTNDADWQGAEWMLCGEMETEQTEWMSTWDIEYTFEQTIESPTHLRFLFEYTNFSDKNANQVVLDCMVRDSEGRVCGIALPMLFGDLKPGATGRNAINIRPSTAYAGNPFTLIDTIEGLTAEFSIQRRSVSINRGCLPVMPWERENT